MNDLILQEHIDKNKTPIIVESNQCIQKSGLIQQHKQLIIENLDLNFYQTNRSKDTKTYVQIEKPYIQMHFELSSGQTHYIPRQKNGISIETTQGRYSLFHLPNIDGHLYDPKGQDLKSLEIQFSKEWMIKNATDTSRVIYRFLNDLITNTPSLLGNQTYVITPAMLRIIHDIYHCTYKGNIKKIFIEGSVMTLLGHILQEAIPTTNKVKPTALSNREREAILFIKDKLTIEYQSTQSIEELALQAGMNRTKLQAGFKSLFQCTVHEYTIQTRMNKAYEILSNSSIYGMNIAEVAKHIGYSHYNHFSNAFKKQFGITPSALTKKTS